MRGTTIHHECGRIHVEGLLREAGRDRRRRASSRTRRPERGSRGAR